MTNDVSENNPEQTPALEGGLRYRKTAGRFSVGRNSDRPVQHNAT